MLPSCFSSGFLASSSRTSKRLKSTFPSSKRGYFPIKHFFAFKLILEGKRYPTGSIFFYIGGYLKRIQGDMKGAIECFEVSRNSSIHIPQLRLDAIYELVTFIPVKFCLFH